MASLMRRQLIRTKAPILSRRSRIVPQVAVGELGVLETDPAQGAEQNIGHGREPEAELVCLHGRRGGPVGEEGRSPA